MAIHRQQRRDCQIRCSYRFPEAARPPQSNSIRTSTGNGEPPFLAGANCIFLTLAAASFIFSSRRPLGDSVLNDFTRPFASTVIIKTILLVPASCSFGAAASHIAPVGFSAVESRCTAWAVANATHAVRRKHTATLFIGCSLLSIGAVFHCHLAVDESGGVYANLSSTQLAGTILNWRLGA